MANPEHGSGWEIMRRYVSPDTAMAAGWQALNLIDGGSPYIELFDPQSSTNVHCRNYELNAWDPVVFPDVPNNLMEDEEAKARNLDLLAVHQMASRYVGTDVKTGQVNVFDPDGYIRMHRDWHEGDTIIVNLLGNAKCTIIDPVTFRRVGATVTPGDAVYFENPDEEGMRPLHKFLNISPTRRVSLLE